MKLYSSGDAAKLIGISRDSLIMAIRNGSAPDASFRIGGQRVFSEDDIKKMKKWARTRTTRRPVVARNTRRRKPNG